LQKFDKLRPDVILYVSPVDGRAIKPADTRMTTWMDYLGDLLFQLVTPLPIIAIASILMFVIFQRKGLLYTAFISSILGTIKLIVYVFGKQDDDLQFAMWEGCVLLPYGTFVILVAIIIFACYNVFKFKNRPTH